MDTKALVTLCQKGNGQALSLLYENYSEKMLKVCLRYIPDPTIAQDLLHDGFVIIFTSIHSLRNPEKLEYWMKKIMRNLALQYLNHANANPTIPLTDIPEEEEPAENPVDIRCGSGDPAFISSASYNRVWYESGNSGTIYYDQQSSCKYRYTYRIIQSSVSGQKKQ